MTKNAQMIVLQMVQACETPEPEITLLELSRKLRGYHIIVGLAFLVSLAAFPGKLYLRGARNNLDSQIPPEVLSHFLNTSMLSFLNNG